jgi:cell division protein FtsN
MKNSETGEFELVLGNKQLLSGFFLVVILFAVFFVMGYIVGRNSTPTTQLAGTHDQNSAATPSGARPQPASGSAPVEQNPPAAVAEPPKDDAGAATPATEPQPTTQPAQPAQTKTEAAPPAAAPPAQPAPGETYLQAYSGKQEVAETVSHTLKQKGFPTLLSPGPQGKTRVLVGPYPDLGKLGQAKADLERLGFSPFRQKIER